ncbi:MAG: hypothetical protein NZ602_16995, partial [Thermoguttaceae bacterium]|nr:hypothetical protein [Thermoguttaceae bacterium]
GDFLHPAEVLLGDFFGLELLIWHLSGAANRIDIHLWEPIVNLRQEKKIEQSRKNRCFLKGSFLLFLFVGCPIR